MDEGGPGFDGTARRALRVISKGTHVAVGMERTIATDPGRAPAEAGDPVALEALGEGPQLVKPERLGGTDHEVLTHRRGC